MASTLCSLAFKLWSDPYVGKLVFFRVYSGQLQKGDIIVEIAGQSIANIDDYTYALEILKIGQPARQVVSLPRPPPRRAPLRAARPLLAVGPPPSPPTPPPRGRRPGGGAASAPPPAAPRPLTSPPPAACAFNTAAASNPTISRD